MPFESEQGDLQELNITIQIAFLSLNSLYIIKFFQFDIEMKKICSLKVKWGDSNMN
jgi:hypothetical protein